MRVVLILFCFIASAAAAFYGQPLLHDNSDAVLIIVTVMAIFAGFLVAIITILGDPAMIPDGSWRIAETRRDSIEGRLSRHVWLFTFYLITIGLLFAGVLLGKAPDSIVSTRVKIWIERAYLFFSVGSFLFTFALPVALLKFQIARIDAEIARRRAKAGIKDDNHAE